MLTIIEPVAQPRPAEQMAIKSILMYQSKPETGNK